jgi:hypothetical protein
MSDATLPAPEVTSLAMEVAIDPIADVMSERTWAEARGTARRRMGRLRVVRMLT